MAEIGYTLGKVSEFSMFGTVLPGHTAALREVLHDLDQRAIFRAIPTIHFARFVILETSTEPGADSYLLFTSNYDGTLDQLLADLTTGLAAELSAVWSHCEGWPGEASLAAFTAFVERTGVTANMFYAAYPQATLKDVLRGLRVEAAVQDLLDAVQQ